MYTEIAFETAHELHAERLRQAELDRMATQVQRASRLQKRGLQASNIGETITMIVGRWGWNATHPVRG